MLKAHVAKHTADIPPRVHNLVRLADIAGLKLPSQDEQFLHEFGIYQMEGHYPDSEQIPLDENFTEQEISRAEEVLKWLKNQLQLP